MFPVCFRVYIIFRNYFILEKYDESCKALQVIISESSSSDFEPRENTTKIPEQFQDEDSQTVEKTLGCDTSGDIKGPKEINFGKKQNSHLQDTNDKELETNFQGTSKEIGNRRPQRQTIKWKEACYQYSSDSDFSQRKENKERLFPPLSKN